MYHSMIALWPTIAAISVGLMTGIYTSALQAGGAFGAAGKR